jgi:hypothetical protein
MATERKIGNVVYRCDKLPASDGLKMFSRVTRLFREDPGMISSIAFSGAEKRAPAAFLRIALMDEGDGESIHDLLVDLAQLCTDGKDQCVVGVKPAQMEDLIQVAWFAMEVNFKDFLSASMEGVLEPAGQKK